MNRTKKIFAILLSLQCATVSAQTSPGRCSFESQLASDEQALLDGVKSALTPMSNNPACAAQAGQIRTFEQALTAYNQQSAATDGVSCMNYEGHWNSRFNDFANNWNSPTGDSAYSSCRGKTNREEAIQCAALITSSQKSTQKTNCESQRDTITTTASNALRTQTFQTGLTALNDVISNSECMESAGERKINLIQNAVGLASQAATIAMLGTGVGLLIGGAAQLVNAAIGNIFRNPSRQAMAVLDNRENFSKIACLYEQVENKALRCERISASRQVDVLKNMFDQSSQFCDENGDVLRQNELMTSIDGIIRNLNTAPAEGRPAPGLTQESFDSLVDQLREPFAGKDGSKLDVAQRSAREVKERLDAALADDASLTAFLRESESSTPLSSTQLRRQHRELSARRDRAAAVLALVNAVKEADAKGTQMGDSDRQNVEKLLKEFNGGSMSFTGAFNDVMITRASFGDDFGSRLAAYNSRLLEASVHHQRVELYQNLNEVSSASFEDGGRFAEAKTAIGPHLHRVLRRDMDTLLERAKRLADIPGGTPSRAMLETLRTQEESVIYPIMRACNQLRTVMATDQRRGSVEPGLSGQPSVCQVFHCGNGLQTFENYLEVSGVRGLDLRNCDATCRAHYDRYVCQAKSSLSSARERMKSELLRNGTICGRTLRQAFERAEGP